MVIVAVRGGCVCGGVGGGRAEIMNQSELQEVASWAGIILHKERTA